MDLTFTFQDREESQSFFLRRFPIQAFKLIEIELSFMFDTLCTKAELVHTSLDLVARCTSLCMILPLSFFCHAPKGDYKEVNRIITYVLLVIALALDTVWIALFISSDWAFI